MLWNRPKLGAPQRDARQQVLTEWRGIDVEPMEKAQALAAKDMKRLLASVSSDLKLEQRRADTEILRAWSQLIDPNITAHAQPASFAHGTLFINVDSPVWLSDIVRFRRKEILERMQHCFGKSHIARISFRIG